MHIIYKTIAEISSLSFPVINNVIEGDIRQLSLVYTYDWRVLKFDS